MTKFTIKLKAEIDYRIYFKIFDTKKLMYKYYDNNLSEFDRNWKGDKHDFGGLCSPIELNNFKNDSYEKCGYSTLLLAFENMNIGIIVHEVSHSISSFMRIKYNVCNFGSDIGKREEEFAYHLGYVINELKNLGYLRLTRKAMGL